VISTPFSIRYAAFLILLLSVTAALTLLPGEIVITRLEGDLMHTLSASQRMAGGEMPHLDFMTPLGVLAFAPVALWLSQGFFLGKAILLADAMMAAILLPAIWWIGLSRLSKAQAYYFGALVVVLLMAVTNGNGSSFIVLALHYNRWAWALAFVVLAAVLFPPKVNMGERWVAPVLIGGGMAALAMLKMTFFVTMAPAILIILLTQKRYVSAIRALIAGAGVAAILVAFLGVDFFIAYFDDLYTVTKANSGRTAPWESFSIVVAGSFSILGMAVMFGALMVFRKSGNMAQGLVMLLLMPVFSYITYQNWGNDPKWMLIVVLYLWVQLPAEGEIGSFGLPAKQSIMVLAVVGAVTIFPTAFSLVLSPVRAALIPRDSYVLIENPPMAADIRVKERQLSYVGMSGPFEGMPSLQPREEPIEINGFTFPDCQSNVTAIPMAAAMTAQVEQLEMLQGQPVLTADSLDINWLFGDLTRVQGAAPWYYGDDAGFENAAFLLVPICPLGQKRRRSMVLQFQNAGYVLTEVYRSSLLVLYEVAKPVE